MFSKLRTLQPDVPLLKNTTFLCILFRTDTVVIKPDNHSSQQHPHLPCRDRQGHDYIISCLNLLCFKAWDLLARPFCCRVEQREKRSGLNLPGVSIYPLFLQIKAEPGCIHTDEKIPFPFLFYVLFSHLLSFLNWTSYVSLKTLELVIVSFCNVWIIAGSWHRCTSNCCCRLRRPY